MTSSEKADLFAAVTESGSVQSGFSMEAAIPQINPKKHYDFAQLFATCIAKNCAFLSRQLDVSVIHLLLWKLFLLSVLHFYFMYWCVSLFRCNTSLHNSFRGTTQKWVSYMPLWFQIILQYGVNMQNRTSMRLNWITKVVTVGYIYIYMIFFFCRNKVNCLGVSQYHKDNGF